MNWNRIWFVVVFSAILIIGATVGHAYDRDIHVEWTKYTGPVGAVTTGFNLYQDGSLACQFPGKDAIAGDCTVNLTKLDTGFTLTAAFSDNKESPQSTPFVLRDYGPAPQGLKVVVTIRTVSSFTTRGNITAKTTVTSKEVPADAIVDTKPINYWNSKTKQYISQTVLVM